MLITETYREQNKRLHDAGNYGVTAPQWFPAIGKFLDTVEPRTVLDYGSGSNRWLEQGFGERYAVHSYDPCLQELSADPPACDAVVSIDVFEHIEPDCVDAVLAHVRSKTLKAGFFTINTAPAKKVLSDGRNAHLIQEGPHWWLPKLWKAGFKLTFLHDKGREFLVVVR